MTSYLKEQRSDIAAWLIDPPGSALFSYVTTGEVKAEGTSITEGIGIGRVTANYARAKVDDAMQGTDRQVVEMAQHLLRKDGLFVGGSAALNAVGATKLARQLGPGKVIATILTDGGTRYISSLYDREWQQARNLVPEATDLSFLD